MGMSPYDYWCGPSDLKKAYRQARDIRKQEENERLWLQGMYFYEAVSVALHRAFNKNSSNVKYAEKPYDLGYQKKRQTKAQANEEKTQNTVSFLHRLTNQFNTQFAEKKKKQAEEMLNGQRVDEKSEQDSNGKTEQI